MPAPDRPPSFQMYPRDFLGDKNVEALEALPWPRGHVAAWAYMRLCLKAWEEAEPGVLPDDDVILAALSKLGKRWLEYRDLIARCFVVRDGKWTQKRMVRERAAQIERRKRLIEAGRKGGRRSRKRTRIAGDASAKPQPGSGKASSHAQAPREGLPLASASAVASAGEESNPTHRPGVASPSAQNGQAPTPVAEWDEGFDADFWPRYPRQVRRSEALAQWRTLKPWTQGHLDAICAGLTRWLAYWQSRGTAPDKIPYPAAFLRGRQHEDQPQ